MLGAYARLATCLGSSAQPLDKSAGPGWVKPAVQVDVPRLTEQAGGPVRSYAALIPKFRTAGWQSTADQYSNLSGQYRPKPTEAAP
jgi:hypothetical protein